MGSFVVFQSKNQASSFKRARKECQIEIDFFFLYRSRINDMEMSFIAMYIFFFRSSEYPLILLLGISITVALWILLQCDKVGKSRKCENEKMRDLTASTLPIGFSDENAPPLDMVCVCVLFFFSLLCCV